MSGLYNMLFGANPIGPVLVKLAGLEMDQIPRYRDAFIEDDCIVIYTRSGGGNDECWCDNCIGDCIWSMNNDLRESPGFVSFEYDEFDCTYGYFRFEPTDKEVFQELKALQGDNPPESIGEKFQALLASFDG